MSETIIMYWVAKLAMLVQQCRLRRPKIDRKTKEAGHLRILNP